MVTHDESEPEFDDGLELDSDDVESDGDDGGDGLASDRFDRWRKESALGAVGTGIARGLHAVFAPRVDEVVIVASVPGDPPDADQRVRVVLDPDDPTKSVAIMPEQADPGAADPI